MSHAGGRVLHGRLTLGHPATRPSVWPLSPGQPKRVPSEMPPIHALALVAGALINQCATHGIVAPGRQVAGRRRGTVWRNAAQGAGIGRHRCTLLNARSRRLRSIDPLRHRIRTYNSGMRFLRLLALGAILSFLTCLAAQAGVAPFDLVGPDLQVSVTRGHETLPIAQVPNLAQGDRLWIRADLPSTQSEHYLLIVAFLRGATNPPPKKWFHSCETWEKRCARKGMTLPVPTGAEQVLVFLAPETEGDFRTLIGSVRGRPGAFVRTSQDLNQATLDISRLNRYLDVIQSLDASAPERLSQAAPRLARSLAIKVNVKCLQRIPQLQAPCLMRGGQSLILNDGHSTSIVEALTSGPAAALAMEASYTPQLSYGYYSPYIASVLDIARIFSSFTTAHYQYIPALATQYGNVLSLTLNTPPSFHDPKSVLVTALPAIEASQLPPLHAVNPKENFCARKTPLVLPVEGAPLVFSTQYAHHMRLRLTTRSGRTLNLPARADAELGGFVIDTRSLDAANLATTVHGTLRGQWGFARYAGPSFTLENPSAQGWSVATPGEAAVIVGREDTIDLTADNVSCIADITVHDAAGQVIKTQWKPVHSDEVQVQLPLQRAQPGPLSVIVKQFGPHASVTVPLEAYSEPASLDRFTLHAGDNQGVLVGSRLDEVAALTMDGVAFAPGTLTTHQGVDRLTLTAQNPQAAAQLKQGQSGLASVRLKDGRILRLQDIVAAPRPGVVLIAKSVYLPHANAASHITLVDSNELPQHAQLTFSVRAKWPTVFDRDEMIEVATADGSYSTTLSLTNGGITLESQSVAIATLDPARVFGPSAFGPLRFRVIDAGVKGDWQSLVTLVRLPQLHKLVCPATAKLACKLTGTDLFLVAALANNAAFEHPVEVPDGFPGYALPVPHPKDGKLYVKLRDDPQVINLASIAARHLPPSPALLGDVPRGSAVANTALHNAPKGARAVPVVVPVARRSTPAAHPAPAPAGSAAAPSKAATSGPEVAKKSAPHGPVSAPAPQEAVAHAPGSNPAAPVAPAPTAVPAATPETSASPVAGSGTTHTRQPPQG